MRRNVLIPCVEIVKKNRILDIFHMLELCNIDKR